MQYFGKLQKKKRAPGTVPYPIPLAAGPWGRAVDQCGKKNMKFWKQIQAVDRLKSKFPPDRIQNCNRFVVVLAGELY